MLERRGAKLVDADKIAHEVMRPGQPVYHKLLKHFGREIVQSDGTIDRKKLADAVFGTGRVAELNQIVHPAIIAEQDRAMADCAATSPTAIVVVEAALIFEAGVAQRFDKIVAVTCSREHKIERFAQRHAVDHAAAAREVDRRMAAQWADQRKAGAADFVIDNSGSLKELELHVDRVYQQLQTAAKQPSSKSSFKTQNVKL